MLEFRSLRVLLVEDRLGSVESLGPTFRTLGYEIEVADQPTLKSTWNSPDVVVLGLAMCEAETSQLGRELCQQAWLRTPLVVGLADSNDPHAERTASDVGVHLVLRKPVDVAVLAGVLRRFRGLLAGLEQCESER